VINRQPQRKIVTDSTLPIIAPTVHNMDLSQLTSTRAPTKECHGPLYTLGEVISMVEINGDGAQKQMAIR
jgi:hypothetical protein